MNFTRVSTVLAAAMPLALSLSLSSCSKLENQLFASEVMKPAAEGGEAGQHHEGHSQAGSDHQAGNVSAGQGGHEESAHEEGHGHQGGHEHAVHRLVCTSPLIKDVVSTQRYVSQIHSRRHIEICALETGYLDAIPVKEGQAVTSGEAMFRIVPTLFKARLDTELAEAQLARIEYANTKKLQEQNIVSQQELNLSQAKLAKAQAKIELAQAEFNFTEIRAPFDGIIDRLHHQQGSLIEEGETLTTLSDNELMWVYFNVPEARYLEYKRQLDQNEEELQIELLLADGSTFHQHGRIGAIEADFNNETGNIAFRADFPNPDGLLRHGQTGTVMIHRNLPSAIVIPQRATFEILAKQYVYVVGDDHVVHPQEIKVKKELEDVFVIDGGLTENDKIVFEGIRQVRDGEKVEYDFVAPTEILAHLKNHAE